MPVDPDSEQQAVRITRVYRFFALRRFVADFFLPTFFATFLAAFLPALFTVFLATFFLAAALADGLLAAFLALVLAVFLAVVLPAAAALPDLALLREGLSGDGLPVDGLVADGLRRGADTSVVAPTLPCAAASQNRSSDDFTSGPVM